MSADFQPTSVPIGDGQVALYLATLTRRRVSAAQTLLASVLRDGVPPADIRLRLFQPALREMGELWQQGRLDLSDSLYISDATRWLMAHLPKPPAPRRDGPRPRLTIGCAPGEAHGIGAQMVAAHFEEVGGWDVTLLESGLSERQFVREVAATLPDMAAVSVTLERHLPAAGALVRALRCERATHFIPIIVGGLPFQDNAPLRRVVLADLYGSDAADGLARAEQFLAQRPRTAPHPVS